MPTWAFALIGAAGAPLVGFLFTSFLPREKTVAFGKKMRSFCQSFLGQKIGKAAGGALVGRFSSTLHDFTTGFMDDPDTPEDEGQLPGIPE